MILGQVLTLKKGEKENLLRLLQKENPYMLSINLLLLMSLLFILRFMSSHVLVGIGDGGKMEREGGEAKGVMCGLVC